MLFSPAPSKVIAYLALYSPDSLTHEETIIARSAIDAHKVACLHSSMPDLLRAAPVVSYTRDHPGWWERR